MSMLMRNGDYLPDGAGSCLSADARAALLGRVVCVLTARRGGFPLRADLGSNLYRLPMEKPAKRAALAKQYVEEALRNEEGLTVEAVAWQGESGTLRVALSYREETLFVDYALPQEKGEG